MRLNRTNIQALSRSILELYRPKPVAEIPRHFVSVLEGLIPNEYLTYNDFRPETQSVDVTWSVEVPDYHQKLAPVFEKYMRENPLIAKFFKIGPSIPAMKVTDEMAMKAFKRTHLYNEFYRELGVDYQLGCAVSTRHSPFLALAFNRKTRDFTRDEVFILNLLRGHVQQALEISHSLASAHQSVHSIMSTVQRNGSGVLVFSEGYRVLFISSLAAATVLALFGRKPANGRVLPAGLKDCIVQMKGDSSAEIPAPRRPVVFRQADGSLVRLKLALDPECSSHCLIFECERNFTSPEQIKALGLSARETDVAYWIIQNKTNWEIGKILNISIRTVDKHVENIFIKLGVNNRAHLISKARELCDPLS